MAILLLPDGAALQPDVNADSFDLGVDDSRLEDLCISCALFTGFSIKPLISFVMYRSAHKQRGWPSTCQLEGR